MHYIFQRLKSVLIITSGVGIILGYLVFFRKNYNKDEKKGKTEKDKLESCLKAKESEELNKCQEETCCSKSIGNDEVSKKGLDDVGGEGNCPESVLSMGGSLWNIKVVTAANKFLKDDVISESSEYDENSNESISTPKRVPSPPNNLHDPLNTCSQNNLVRNHSEQEINAIHVDSEVENDIQNLSKSFQPLCNASENIANNDKSLKDYSNLNIPIKKTSTPIYSNKTHCPSHSNKLYNSPCGDYLSAINGSFFDESWPYLEPFIESPPENFILPLSDLKRIEEWDLDESPRTSLFTPNINSYSLFVNTSINSLISISSSNSETSTSSATNSFPSFSSASLSSHHAASSFTPVSTYNTLHHSTRTSCIITPTRASVSEPSLHPRVAKHSLSPSYIDDLSFNHSTSFQSTINSKSTHQPTINPTSTNNLPPNQNQP